MLTGLNDCSISHQECFYSREIQKGIKSAEENVHLIAPSCTSDLKILSPPRKLLNVHCNGWGESLGLNSGLAPKAIYVFYPMAFFKSEMHKQFLVPKIVPHPSRAVLSSEVSGNQVPCYLFLIWSYLSCICCCQGVLLGQDRWTEIPLALCFL